MIRRAPRPAAQDRAWVRAAAALGRAGAPLALLAGLVLGAALAGPAAAQGFGFGAESDEPLEINADDGIEWRREEKVYIARGNASAARAEVKVRAETLTAHYRDTAEGGTDIWRIDADGDVVLSSLSGTAYGDKGVYDVVKGILVLKGGDLKLETQTYTVTARESLEYWHPQQMAVARGDARVVSEGRRLEADVVTAYFHDVAAKAGGEGAVGGEASGTRLQRIEAFGDVQITTPREVARGERGVYDVESGIATLYGSVKITRDQDQLNGEYGEVNLNTGVSRLLAGPPGGEAGQRVRALFSPRKKPEIAPREKSGEARPAP